MKKLIILPLLFLTLTLYSQSTKISPFEEMWIVAPESLHTDLENGIALAPESMTYEKMSSVNSFTDLNKIIADTPFLSLRLIPSTMKNDSKEPAIKLGDRLEPGKSLKGWGSWLVVFENDDDIVLGIPTHEPEKMKKFLDENNFQIIDKKGKLQKMTISEIRIESVTHSKTN